MRHHLQILGIPADHYGWVCYPKHSECQLIWDGKLLPEKTAIMVECSVPNEPFPEYTRKPVQYIVTINNKTYKNCKVTMGPLPAVSHKLKAQEETNGC